MAMKRHLYVYFNNQGIMSTQILHGSGVIRQGDSFEIYALFEEDSNLEDKLLFIQFKPPGREEKWSSPYLFTNLGSQIFKKNTPREMTYDLVDGKSYLTYKIAIPNDIGVTDKYGDLQGLVFSVSQSEVDLEDIGPSSYETLEVFHNGLVHINIEKTYGSGAVAEVSREEYIYLLSEIASLYNKLSAEFLNKHSDASDGDILELLNKNAEFKLIKTDLESGQKDEFSLTDGFKIGSNSFSKDLSISLNNENNIELFAKDIETGAVTRIIVKPEYASLNGDIIVTQTTARQYAVEESQKKYEQSSALLTETANAINARINSILEGSEVDFDTFKEISDKIKEFMAEHEEFIAALESVQTKKNKIVQNEAYVRLESNSDYVFTEDSVKSVVIVLPSHIDQGFYSSLSFNSGEQPTAISFQNQSDKKIILTQNGRQISNYFPVSNSNVRMFIDCDGKTIYVAIQEFLTDALY